MLFLNPFNLYAYPCMFFLGFFFFFFFFVYIHTPLTENGNKDKECQVHAILSLSRQLYQRTDLGDLRTT
jgi:hypothetical protein